MTTYSVMQARIADDMVRDDLASQIANAINDAIALQEGERYKFNEKRYQILTVADQEYYDLKGPTLLTSAGAAVGTGEALLEIDNITVTISNWPYSLCPRTQQHIDDWQTSTWTGQPTDYTLYGGQLRLYPIPDAVYTLDLSGLARLSPNPLSSGSHENAWTAEGAPIIRAQAKILLYRDILRDPDGVMGATQQLVEAGGNPAPAAARRRMAAQAFTGRVRPWSL